MSISLRPEHLKRYASIAMLLVRHGRADWVQQMGLDAALRESGTDATPEVKAKAEELAADLEQLGPTFVKLGQLLSGRADLLPPQYLEALSRLQDDTAPFPFEEVEKIVSAELGVRISRAFSEFDPKPIAAASLGQVHAAQLRDGRAVAVKVQRPGVREQVMLDFEALESIAEFIDQHTEFGKAHAVTRHLAELKKNVIAELDYHREAANLVTLADNLAEFETIVVPRPIDGFCSSRVLTMQHIRGSKIPTLSPAVLLEVDGAVLARELFRAYLKQLLVDGFFHADPHPGNILLTDDRKLAMLDLGLVGRLTPDTQQGLLKMLLAISEGRGESASDEAVRLAESTADADPQKFHREIADVVGVHATQSVGELHVGRLLLQIQSIAGACGYRLHASFTMIGKMLLNLDRIGKVLDAGFDPNAAIRNEAIKLMKTRVGKSFTLGNILQTTLEANEFVQRLPQRLNQVLDSLATKELKIRVDAFDENHLLKGLHKIANRITAGLVLAALILGAALLTRVETPFRLWGYPGFAMLLFMAATMGGLILLIRIHRQDMQTEVEVNKTRKRRP